MAACQRDRLLADALHQAAVAGNHVGVVIDQLAPVAPAQDFLGHGKADRVGDPLTQRSGRGLDPIGVAIFGMACRDRAPLAKILDLL